MTEQLTKLKAGHYIYKDFDIIWVDANKDNGFVSKWFVNTPTFQLVKTTDTKKEAVQAVDDYIKDWVNKRLYIKSHGRV